MKKVAYLTMMFVALTLMSFSCEKEENDDQIVVKTLEELYPEWSYLYGEAPEVGEGTPSITITIDENVGTFVQKLPQIPQTYTYTFNKIVIEGSTITLKDGQSFVASGEFTTKSGSDEILTLHTSGVAIAQYSATYTF